MKLLENTASAVITCAPIAGECGRNSYAGAGACMNEVAVANINTNMRSTRFICGKENQIAGRSRRCEGFVSKSAVSPCFILNPRVMEAVGFANCME